MLIKDAIVSIKVLFYTSCPLLSFRSSYVLTFLRSYNLTLILNMLIDQAVLGGLGGYFLQPISPVHLF